MSEGGEESLAALPRERTQVLPALHLLHAAIGYLSTDGLERIGSWLHVPLSELYAVATSYTDFRLTAEAAGTVQVCRGLSCRMAGGEALASALRGAGRVVDTVECRFACALAPVVSLAGALIGRASADAVPTVAPDLDAGPGYIVSGEAKAAPLVDGQVRRLLARLSERESTSDAVSLEAARGDGAYEGLAKARAMAPEDAVAVVEASGLRGRGGAYFPVHLKWRSARDAVAAGGAPFLVVNAEEGEPGVFKDRALMEGDPHQLVEGIAIAAYAIGAEHAYCFINGQAELSARRMADALDDATAAGLIGVDVGLVVEIRRGAGGYVCGEETVILESIEGGRAVPRLRPPFPTESGLWGRPTVINNVETLGNLPDLFRLGAAWFRDVGLDDAPGTKLISLSGAVERPGLLEVPMGTPIAEILRMGGAMDVVGAVLGGPSGGVLPAEKFDRAIGPGAIDEAGAVLGAGGIVVIGPEFSVADVVAIHAAYNASESCGKCTPCREGGERLSEALTRLRDGEGATEARRDIDELLTVMRAASLCGLGQMAPNPVTSALQDFPEALGVIGGDQS